RARQYSCAIAQQTAVRGVVNVSFHHRRIHPQPLPSRNLFLLGYGHQSLMNLLDHIWAEGLQQPSQGLRIRNFLCSDPRKLPVDDIGPHLTLGLLKAPVPHVLQYRQPQRNLGGRLLPPTATALRPSHRPAPKILSTPRALGARPRRAWPAHTTRGSSLRSDR